MPTDKPEDYKKNSPENPIPESQHPVAGSEPQQSREDHIRSGQSGSNKTRDKKPQAIDIHKIPKIDVIEGVEANAISKRANKISIWSVIVNGFILLITAFVGYTAVTQTRIAQKTFEADTTYSGKNYRNQVANQRKQDASDTIKAKKEDSVFNAQKDFYASQKMGVDSQIASFKASKKEFDIENRPFLSPYNVEVDTSVKGNGSVKFILVNLGKQPLIITGSHYTIAIRTPDKAVTPTIYTFNGQIDNSIVTGSGIVTLSAQNSDNSNIYFLKIQNYFLYIFGYFRYKPVSINKEYFIRFRLKVSEFPKHSVQIDDLKYN